MKRKFLEDLGLEKEVIDKVLDENMKDIGNAKGETSSLENQVAALKADKEGLEKQLKERDGQLETLKKESGSVDDLKKRIETLEAENKTNAENHQKEITGIKINNAIDKALAEARAKNITAVASTGHKPVELPTKIQIKSNESNR